MGHPQIIAHRWLDASRKQDVSSRLEEILNLGVKIIECDVQETRDGEFILSHDPYLPNLPTLRKKIKTITSKEIIKNYGEKFYQNISLTTLLKLLKEKSSLKINLEIKDPDLDVGKLIKVIPQEYRSQIFISSFYPKVLKSIPSDTFAEKWLLVSLSLRRHPFHLLYALMPIIMAKLIKTTGIAPHYKLVSGSLVKKASKQGLKVITWTVNDPKKIKRLGQMEVWGVITDNY